MSIFHQMRKKVTTTYLVAGVDVEFTLLAPSAHARNMYLLKCEECAQDEVIAKQVKTAVEAGKVDTSNINFKSIAENEKMSMYLIALCLHESLEHKPTLEECWEELKQNVDSDFIDHFYAIATKLTWPEPPKDALDPKADQGKDSHTD